MLKQQIDLSSGWEWRLSDSNGNVRADSISSIRKWQSSAHMPSVIQMELMAQDVIPDPHVGENERDIQWVSEADWLYACSFSTPEWALKLENLQLVFQGLD